METSTPVLSKTPVPELPLFARATIQSDRIAIREDSVEFSYRDLLEASTSLAKTLLQGGTDLAGARVAFPAGGDFGNIVTQWAIWRAGGVAVPLGVSATGLEIEYALADAEVGQVIVPRRAVPKFEALCTGTGRRLIIFEDRNSESSGPLPALSPSRPAMILYTSGTTSKPKGVVTTHANIQAQIESLVKAWEWTADDRIPLFLPMHHIHGIINIVSCALWSGAMIEVFPRFHQMAVLERVAAGAYTLFMAVPTIYVKLIEALEARAWAEDFHRGLLRGFAEMRLMVSGSAALPASVHQTWTALTGQHLLERYGMTETGMTLSNPLHGERRPGSVGRALPGVEVRLKSEAGNLITAEAEPGELQMSGPGIFLEYWNRPEITAEAFDEGWFRTGDMAALERGYYRIMGRLSVDIIKSGGYKLSALEIEASLLEHPAIRECAVIGLPDETWGEMVAVVAVLEPSAQPLTLEDLRAWSSGRISKYKLPKRLVLLDQLPRNAMGKVTKPGLGKVFSEVV